MVHITDELLADRSRSAAKSLHKAVPCVLQLHTELITDGVYPNADGLLRLAQCIRLRVLSILKGGDKPSSTQQSTQQALTHSGELQCLVGILVSKAVHADQQTSIDSSMLRCCSEHFCEGVPDFQFW